MIREVDENNYELLDNRGRIKCVVDMVTDEHGKCNVMYYTFVYHQHKWESYEEASIMNIEVESETFSSRQAAKNALVLMEI